MPTTYLSMIDEAAMLERLPLERVGTWDGELPVGDIAGSILTTRVSNCSQLQANGSRAGYEVMEGLGSTEEFADGVLIGGAQYLPIAAFHERMYYAVMDRIAEVLAEYDTVVARVFERGVVRGPLGRIGDFRVEFYGADMAWCGNGHVGDEVIVWRVVKAEAPEALAEETAPEETEEQPVVRKRRKRSKEEVGDS